MLGKMVALLFSGSNYNYIMVRYSTEYGSHSFGPLSPSKQKIKKIGTLCPVCISFLKIFLQGLERQFVKMKPVGTYFYIF